jgi:hypothetical protein
MGFGLRSELSMFSWSPWTANPPSIVCDYVEEHLVYSWSNLRNILTSRYEPRMSNVYQVDLQPVRKDIIMCKKGSMDKFLLILPLLPMFCPTQGHPTKAFGTHSDICVTNWIEERFNQGTMKMYPFTCSYFYSSDFLLFVINPQHQPLIKSNTNKNIKPAMV